MLDGLVALVRSWLGHPLEWSEAVREHRRYHGLLQEAQGRHKDLVSQGASQDHLERSRMYRVALRDALDEVWDRLSEEEQDYVLAHPSRPPLVGAHPVFPAFHVLWALNFVPLCVWASAHGSPVLGPLGLAMLVYAAGHLSVLWLASAVDRPERVGGRS